MGMGGYTQFLSQKGNSISPEDENYIQELLEIASSFRTFDAALDEFIVQKGYTGNLADTDAKVRFIKCKFDEAGIPIEARVLKGWFQKHTQAEKRDYAIQFCFAFHLTLDETRDFFRRVYLQRNLDCHTIREAIYYYCIRHRLSYSEAQALIEKAPKESGKGPVDLHSDVLFTGTIVKELDRFQSPEELLAFLTANSSQFGYNNATAKKYICELWRRIAGENGLAVQELKHRYPKETFAEKSRSAWDIYRQIFGLLDFDESNGEKLYPISGDRTLQPLLKANAMIHPLVSKSFPDRQGLEAIIGGNWQSDEVVRKTMILLAFYRFWTELLLKGTEPEYAAKPYDGPRCIASINRLLLDASYPELYESRPYLNIPEWSAAFVEADPEQIGMAGSPTKVKGIENVVFTAKESLRLENNDEQLENLIKELITNHTIG